MFETRVDCELTQRRASGSVAAPSLLHRRYWRAGVMAAFAVVGLLFTSPLSIAALPVEGLADLVDKVKPAVVNIATTIKGPTASEGSANQFRVPPELRGTPFEEFLRRYFGQRPSGGEDEESGRSPRTALGSGFIIDPAGYVVTNNHVIRDGAKILVTLADGRKFDASVVGRDDKTDIALLKVTAGESLPYVTWGDSDKVRVGDLVLAVGNAFGLGGTVTAGIVSARGRDIQSGPFDDYLQIDAPINRGNSGGPSFDRNGQVIGINAAIYSPNGGSVGIGFAIPSSLAKPIVQELRDRGRIERGYLGVKIQPLSKTIADSLGLDTDKGALIIGVEANGPAAKAGMRQGDVIRSVNSKTIDEFRDLARLVAAAGPEKSVVLGVWRDGKDISIPVTLERMPAGGALADGSPPQAQTRDVKTVEVLGLSLAPIDAKARERFDLSEETKGALILDVKPGTDAAEANLAVGDIIIKVGNSPVATPRDVEKEVQEAMHGKHRSILLLVQRQGDERFVALPLNKG